MLKVAAGLWAFKALLEISTFVICKLMEGPSAPPPSVVHGHSKPSKIEKARRKMGINATEFYNVGFVGNSGVGKSSLVNGLCGWGDSDEGAAPVGITETTQSTNRYTFPPIPTIKFWDLPGGGTEDHPAQTYYEDKCLCAFDSLVLVTASRFTSLDLDIAKRAQKDSIKVFYVHNKIQHDVESEMRRRRSESYEDIFAIVRNKLEKAFQPGMLKAHAGDVKLHLIDARAYVDQGLHQHDEHLLGVNIINALPTGRGERW